MKEMEVRATGIHTMLLVAEQAHGKPFAAALIERIEPPDVRALIKAKRLLPSTWLPLTPYRTLLHGLVAQGLDDTQLRVLSRASVTHDINTIYKLVFKVLTVDLVARQTPKLFAIYYRGADITVLDTGPGYARIQYRACHGFDRLVWLDYVWAAEAVLELTGAKNVKTHVEEGGTGPDMIAAATWET